MLQIAQCGLQAPVAQELLDGRYWNTPSPVFATNRGLEWGCRLGSTDPETSEAYTIGFKNDRVQYVLGSGTGWESLQGISEGNPLGYVLGKFGDPSNISQSLDRLRRIYCFERYNLVFVFKAGVVIHLGIYNPNFGPLEYKQTPISH